MLLFASPRTPAAPLLDGDGSQYISMEDPATSSTATPASGRRIKTPSVFGRLRRLLPFRRSSTPGGGGATPATPPDTVASLRRERERWAAERQELLDDCTTCRQEVQRLTETLNGWSAIVRDALFYGLFSGPAMNEITELFAERLRNSVGEVEGVSEVEISELRLPTTSDAAPEVSLVRYGGPELSEWRVSWSPPPSQASGSITLRGRKFGVTFTLEVQVSKLQLDGQVQCCLSSEEGSLGVAKERSVRVGFKRLPQISFEIHIAGKVRARSPPARPTAAAPPPPPRRRRRTARGVSHPPAPVWGRGVSVRSSRSSGCPSHRHAALAHVKQTAPCTPLRQQSDPNQERRAQAAPALLWPTYQQMCRLFSRLPPGKIFFAARRLISARRRRGFFSGRRHRRLVLCGDWAAACAHLA